MNSHDDWARWGDSWQQQPVVDVNRLRRKVRRKLWRMRVVVALELLTTLIATTQSLWLIWQPGLPLRWKLWAGISLLLVASAQAMFLHLRRGTWNASADTTRDLLRISERRAHAGIRLAKLNAWSTVFVIAATLLLAAPELDPRRWLHDPQLKLMVMVQFAANVPIAIAIFGFCAWYIRRQRRKLERFNALLLDDTDSKTGSSEDSLR